MKVRPVNAALASFLYELGALPPNGALPMNAARCLEIGPSPLIPSPTARLNVTREGIGPLAIGVHGMLPDVPMDLAAYIDLYPPHEPAKPSGASDEHRQLEAEDGLGTLPTCATTMVPARRPGQRDGRHLWVIVPDAVRVILEIAPDVRPPPLSLGVAKHTNLTGGGPAACGGEVWIDPADSRRLYANGGSGRYPAKTPKQLEDAVRVLSALGFTVISAGWSEDNDCPERVFR